MLFIFLLILLLALWYLGYIHISGLTIPDFTLFIINGHDITFYNALIALVILAIVLVLPYPFREIVVVFFVLLALSILGIIPIVGLSTLFIFAIIVTFVIFLLGLF
jgi:hypothetical protein